MMLGWLRGSRFSFANNTFHPIFIFSKFLRQSLEGYLAIEFCIFGKTDFAHPACSDLSH
jgi:hypothetical protein